MYWIEAMAVRWAIVRGTPVCAIFWSDKAGQELGPRGPRVGRVEVAT